MRPVEVAELGIDDKDDERLRQQDMAERDGEHVELHAEAHIEGRKRDRERPAAAASPGGSAPSAECCRRGGKRARPAAATVPTTAETSAMMPPMADSCAARAGIEDAPASPATTGATALDREIGQRAVGEREQDDKQQRRQQVDEEQGCHAKPYKRWPFIAGRKAG